MNELYRKLKSMANKDAQKLLRLKLLDETIQIASAVITYGDHETIVELEQALAEHECKDAGCNIKEVVPQILYILRDAGAKLKEILIEQHAKQDERERQREDDSSKN